MMDQGACRNAGRIKNLWMQEGFMRSCGLRRRSGIAHSPQLFIREMCARQERDGKV